MLIPDFTHPCYGSATAYAGLHHRNEHLCEHEILASALLSSRPGWNRRWCYHRSVPKPLCESHHSIVSTITVQSGINPRATVASIKVLFRGINASIHTRFAIAHAWVLGILHYQECYIAPIQGILPASQLNATVRAAFMPDSTLEFLPFLAVQNAQNYRYLVVFSTHSGGLALGNSLSAFRHKQDISHWTLPKLKIRL